MNCDKCGREIRPYIPGSGISPDTVTATTIDGVYAGMWCPDCRKAAGQDARPLAVRLRELNDRRKLKDKSK
jgi:hypothetical protein